MADLTVVCVSDQEGFAGQVYEYLFSLLERQTRLDEGSNMRIDGELVKLEGEEIIVDFRMGVPRGMIKWALESFLRKNGEKFKDYGVVEFGDSVTIGRILPSSEMELHSCEICGFFTPYAEELQTHRMTHFGV